MSMMRATFVFEDVNKHGWTETIHHVGDNIDDVLVAARVLLPKRKALLGVGARIAYIRVSDDLVKRDSRIFVVPGLDGSGVSFGDDDYSDTANLSVVIRMETTSPIRRRTLYMSGVPDSIIVQSGQFAPTAGWMIAFNQWQELIKTGGWQMRNRSGVVPIRHIVAAVQDVGTGDVTITTDVAHGLGQGDAVIISGTQMPALNGTWQAMAGTAGSSVKIHLNTRLNFFLGFGTLRKLDYVLGPIIRCQIMRASHRNRGRFLDSPVGRRKARTLR